MLPDVTPAVMRTIEMAGDYVVSGEEVSPVHLMDALMEENESAATSLAIRAGLDWNRYRLDVVKRSSPTALPLSAECLSLLHGARQKAWEVTGESTVSGEVVLLHFLEKNQEVRSKLSAYGLDPDRLPSVIQTGSPPVDVDLGDLDISEPTDLVDWDRIMDASLNRCREGLRVLEDYCRFALDDSFLTEQFKTLRHELANLLKGLLPEHWLQSRDSGRDVGANISLDTERSRMGVREVLVANCKRVQESLRSMEEYLKIKNGWVAAHIEQLRYRAYSLERALFLGTRSRERLEAAHLYLLISATDCLSSLEWTIKEAAQGGVQVIQLREKSLTDGELVERARQVRKWTKEAGVLFILNDRPDVARLVEADGVHLGQEDLPVKDARRIMGKDTLIGVSTHSSQQLQKAILDGASYVGVGPVFPSRTKEFQHLSGLEYVKEAFRMTRIPAFAIGGIQLDNVQSVLETGANRLAISSAIIRDENPRQRSVEFFDWIRKANKQSHQE